MSDENNNSAARIPRLAGERIVLFSTADWDTALPTNKHHIARRLAKRNRVLFVETLGTRAPKIGGADAGRIVRRLKRGFSGPVRREKRLWSVSPIVRPKWATAGDIRMNRILFRSSAGRAITAFDPTMLWVYSPYAVHLLPAKGGPLVVYHMVDDLSAVPGADRISLREAELRLLARADIVFCTERQMHERAVRVNPNAHFLPNVADHAHFSDATPRGGSSRALLERLSRSPGPRAVFSGQLASHKVDVALIAAVCRLAPDINFIFVGPIWEADTRRAQFEQLGHLPNVTLTGLVPYEELPPFLHLADVLLMPYARSNATDAVFPLKLFEYFATGNPVVAPQSMHALRPWAQVLQRPRAEPTAWVAAIRQALIEPADFADQRRELARRNTWDTRLRKMERLIHEARSKMSK